jgi:hypothetical protein
MPAVAVVRRMRAPMALQVTMASRMWMLSRMAAASRMAAEPGWRIAGPGVLGPGVLGPGPSGLVREGPGLPTAAGPPIALGSAQTRTAWAHPMLAICPLRPDCRADGQTVGRQWKPAAAGPAMVQLTGKAAAAPTVTAVAPTGPSALAPVARTAGNAAAVGMPPGGQLRQAPGRAPSARPAETVRGPRAGPAAGNGPEAVAGAAVHGPAVAKAAAALGRAEQLAWVTRPARPVPGAGLTAARAVPREFRPVAVLPFSLERPGTVAAAGNQFPARDGQEAPPGTGARPAAGQPWVTARPQAEAPSEADDRPRAEDQPWTDGRPRAEDQP